MSRGARRAAIFAAVVGAAVAVLPTAASAASFKGVVVAQDSARHAIVTASANGAVRTVRVTKAVRVGARVNVSATRGADGTYRAQRVKVTGNGAKVKIRGVLVKRQAGLRRYLVSAGRSVVVVRFANTKRTKDDDDEKPGDQLLINANVTSGTPVATNVQTVGQANALGLEGIFLGPGTTPNTIRIAVAHRGEVFITVPTGFVLPTLAPGDIVEASVTVDPTTSAFTLVSLQLSNGDNNDDDGVEVDEDDGELHAHGAVTVLSATSITVQPGQNAAPVTCAIPTGVTTGTIKVTDMVAIKCVLVNTVWTLEKLRLDTGDDDGDHGDHNGNETRVKGVVTALTTALITVDPGNGQAPVTCTIPAGMTVTGIALTNSVELQCSGVAGALVLTRVHLEDAQAPGGGDDHGGGGSGGGDD
jgi:hypothetical protein